MRGWLGMAWGRAATVVLSKPAAAYAIMALGPAGVLPFAALWLRAAGAPLDSLGLLLALPLLSRLVAARPLSIWAMQFANPWRPITLLCLITTAAAVLALLSLWGTGSLPLWPCILTWWTICFSVGACTPLMDAAILSSREEEGALAYAKGAGAIGYLVANVGVGMLMARFGVTGMIIWAAASSLIAAGLIATLMVRRTRHQPDALPRLCRRGFLSGGGPQKTCLILVVGAAALIEASHGFNAIAMITWRARGYGAGLSGVLWATGIAADVAFLGLMGWIRTRFAPERLLVIGGVAAIARWAGLAAAPPIAVLFALQALHALSFTATYLASVQLVQQLSEQERRLSAQTTNWALSAGLSTGLGTLLACPLYAVLGVHGYWVMIVLAAFGLTAAVALTFKLQPEIAGKAKLVPKMEP